MFEIIRFHKEKPVREQISLLEDLVKIGRLQQVDIHSKGLTECSDDFQAATILNTQKLHVEIFWDRIEFLCRKLKIEKEQEFRFYLPIVRVVLEVYAKLLFLCFQTRKDQFGSSVANYLFALAERKRYSRVDTNTAQLEQSYATSYEKASPYLKREHIDIPENINSFSKEIFKKIGYSPSIEDVFKKKYFFEEVSTETREIFPIKSDDFYDRHYRSWSNFVHGEVYYSMKTTAKNITEMFWLIAENQIFSLLMVELVNKKILANGRSSEIKKWISEFRVKRPNFTNLWKKKRQLK